MAIKSFNDNYSGQVNDEESLTIKYHFVTNSNDAKLFPKLRKAEMDIVIKRNLGKNDVVSLEL
jgi:hypothetical protein